MAERLETQKKIAKFYNNIINTRIRELIEERTIKTDEMAKVLCVSPEAVRLWCSGYARPDIDKILNICKFFGVSADYLLGNSDFKTESERIQYAHTEDVLLENLNKLSDREKAYLIHCLNHVLLMKEKNEDCVDFDIRLMTSVLKCVGLALDEMRLSTVQLEDNDYSGNDISKRSFEIYTNHILNTEMLRNKANQYIDSLFNELKQAYLDILNREMAIRCGESGQLLKINFLQ